VAFLVRSVPDKSAENEDNGRAVRARVTTDSFKGVDTAYPHLQAFVANLVNCTCVPFGHLTGPIKL
jgi:hypothetical protein